VLGSDALEGGMGVGGSDEALVSNNGIASGSERLVIQNAKGVAS
jgi:hypothetical protein